MDRHRNALLRMLSGLLVMVGGGSLAVVPRHLRSAVLRVLRPAESALRRLIVVEAHGLPAPAVTKRAKRTAATGIRRAAGTSVPVFPLFDPRKPLISVKRCAGGGPRVWFFDGEDPPFPVTQPLLADDPVDAKALSRRLCAFQRALDDIPAQARRLARLRAVRRAKSQEPVQQRAVNPMRPGRPPGHRARQKHPVDAVLAECHALALYTLVPP